MVKGMIGVEVINMTDNAIDTIEDDIGEAETTYLTSEVSKMLGMANTTIRKYSQSLESKGYSFTKGQGTGARRARLYTDKDITVLRYLKEIREETNITVERATSVVVERFGKGTTQETLPERVPVTTDLDKYAKQHDELKKTVSKQSGLILKQNKLILNLSERLEQQEDFINEQIDQKVHKIINQNKQIETSKKTTKQKSGLLNRIIKSIIRGMN